MDWDDVPATMDNWFAKTAEASNTLQPVAAMVASAEPIGYYRTADSPLIAILGGDSRDLALAKRAVDAYYPVRPEPLTTDELQQADSGWIKVAHSHSLRRLGELTNFFPGQYPGGLPNAPSPLAAMLTTGLLGAGLGYGAGRLVGGLLPERYGRKLRRTGAVTGGAVAASPAALWGIANLANDHSLLDSWPLDPAAGSDPDLGELYKLGEHAGPRTKAAIEGCVKEASTFADRIGDSLDVNINAVGHTLWDLGATPQLAATTMGALYAAQQLPDPDSRPGVVTGRQLGRLAANAAGDYMNGLVVGAVLNKIVGTPIPATTFGTANMTLGIISEVVPKLFGG